MAMFYDVVVEETRYCDDEAPRDDFQIIGVYERHSDAYDVAKDYLLSISDNEPLLTKRQVSDRLTYGADCVTVGQTTMTVIKDKPVYSCHTTITIYQTKGDLINVI